jgi:hypothetical protein
MAKVSSIGQCTGNIIEIIPKEEETRPLATIAELAAYTGIPEAELNQYGMSGSAIKFSSEADKYYQLFVDGKSAYSLIYFDANGNHFPLFPRDAEAVIKPDGSEWGMAIFKEYVSSTKRYADIQIQEFNPQTEPQFCLKLGSGAASPVSQTYTIQCKGSLSRIERYLGLDLSSTLAVNASAVVLSVPNGDYSFELDSSTAQASDALYAYNGSQDSNGLKPIWTYGDPDPTIDLTASACFGYIAFIAIDKEERDEASEFTVKNLTRTGDITFTPTKPVSKRPDASGGNVYPYDNYFKLKTGKGSLPCDATFPYELPADLTDAVEGSWAEWNLDDGTYEVTYLIRSSDDTLTNDKMYWFDGTEVLTLLDTRESATIVNEKGTIWKSDGEFTKEITIAGGKLGFVCLDTGDDGGTTELRITNIKKK